MTSQLSYSYDDYRCMMQLSSNHHYYPGSLDVASEASLTTLFTNVHHHQQPLILYCWIDLKRAPPTRSLYLYPLVDSFGIFVHTHQLGDLIGFNIHLIPPGDLFGRFYSQNTHLDLLSRWEIYLDFTGTILRFPDPSLHG